MKKDPLVIARQVLQIEAEAIRRLDARLDESFSRVVDCLARCRGRVVTSGMGKSGIVCRKVAATLSSTGTPAMFLHPAEAVHGDLGMLAQGDTVLIISNSGETEELKRLLDTIHRLGLPLISMVGSPESTIARYSDLVLDIGVVQEACNLGLAPTASTTVALALGDALAVALSERKGFEVEEFARLHPGGKLGKKLARVKDLMHVRDQVPVVVEGTSMREVLGEMSLKGMGITAVTDREGNLAGVLTDGDLRRLLQNSQVDLLEQSVENCMTRDPVTIRPEELATRALNLMERRKITSLMVTDDSARIIGIIHLHDLWGTEMF